MPTVNRRMVHYSAKNGFGFGIFVYICPKFVAAALFGLLFLFGFVEEGTQVRSLPELIEGGHGVGDRRI